MKRLVPFDLTHDPQSRRSHGTMLIDPDGPFVLYEDAMAAVLAEREALVHLAEGMDFGDGLVAIDDLVDAIKQRGEK